MLTTTLRRIRALGDSDLYQKIASHLGEGLDADAQIPYATIIAITNLDDALLCTRAEPQHAKVWRLLAVQYARDVQPADADPRSLHALDVAERHAHGQATDEELAAAWRAAWDAADYAAWGATWGAAWDAARQTSLDAARDAAVSAASEAAMDAAGYAAWSAAWDAAWADAIARQTAQFIEAVS